MNVEAMVVKLLAEGKTEFPQISIQDLKKYFHFTDNTERMTGEYVTDIGELEDKYYCNYDRYPEPVKERVEELLEDIRYGDDPNMKVYAIHALRYLVNPTNGTMGHYEIGQVESKLKEMRYGQDELACHVDDALIAEYLSGSDKRMTVLGLWGPPGTGKTTAAEAIAKALDRGYIKVNFGGTSDAGIIKGKNKSVMKAGPSLLLSELARKNGTYSYVVNFDEFDKGTAESYEAFHEFLDPEDEWYYDEYLECNIPKNDFLIILTFNDISKIPTPILDRMRIIPVAGYSLTEKEAIVRNSVIKKYTERLKLENVQISDEAMDVLLREYSVAPGIRDVEKDIEKLLIRMIKKEKKFEELCITEKTIREVLGSKRTWGLNDMGNKVAISGQAMALAVSGSIGSCIAIQVVQDPYQKDPVEISGLLQGSCLESLSDAMSYARRTLKQELPKLHISFRDPSVSKDGASAGVAMYMSIMSCMLDKKLENCAFTGTIDAFGNVGMVGVDEKLSAAEREGIERVYIPQDNFEQMKENNRLDKYKVKIVPISHVNELNKEFFGLEVS
jgi:ATP-dependent Lon protease